MHLNISIYPYLVQILTIDKRKQTLRGRNLAKTLGDDNNNTKTNVDDDNSSLK